MDPKQLKIAAIRGASWKTGKLRLKSTAKATKKARKEGGGALATAGEGV